MGSGEQWWAAGVTAGVDGYGARGRIHNHKGRVVSCARHIKVVGTGTGTGTHVHLPPSQSTQPTLPAHQRTPRALPAPRSHPAHSHMGREVRCAERARSGPRGHDENEDAPTDFMGFRWGRGKGGVRDGGGTRGGCWWRGMAGIRRVVCGSCLWVGRGGMVDVRVAACLCC